MQDFIVTKRRKDWRVDGAKHFLCAFPVEPWVIFQVLYFRRECLHPCDVSRNGVAQIPDLAGCALGCLNLCSFLAASEWHGCRGRCSGIIDQLK